MLAGDGSWLGMLIDGCFLGWLMEIIIQPYIMAMVNQAGCLWGITSNLSRDIQWLMMVNSGGCWLVVGQP